MVEAALLAIYGARILGAHEYPEFRPSGGSRAERISVNSEAGK
jgi:hypothetical protein